MSVGPVLTSVGQSLGLDASLISVTRLLFVLQFVVALSGANQTASSRVTSDALLAAVVAATGSQSGGTTVSVLGTNAVARRRRLLGIVEVTLLASHPVLSSVLGFNDTLVAAAANGTLASVLRTAGVSVGGLYVPVPPVSGAQFTMAVRCPTGAGRPSVPTVMQALSPGGVDVSSGLLANFNAAGLGRITHLAISELPVVGA